jgi:hypothetical protein
MNKMTDHDAADKVVERLLLDIASVKEQQNLENTEDSTENQYWRIMLDEKTQFKISNFLPLRN